MNSGRKLTVWKQRSALTEDFAKTAFVFYHKDTGVECFIDENAQCLCAMDSCFFR